jgi:metal-responsive CopG/Arc/MetJ family transcriptional regulator
MTRNETAISLNMPTELVETLDTIARQKYLKRDDIIIDACAYYCQFYDMNSERFPETMRNVFFNLARHDDEFRKTLRDVLRDDPTGENNTLK